MWMNAATRRTNAPFSLGFIAKGKNWSAIFGQDDVHVYLHLVLFSLQRGITLSQQSVVISDLRVFWRRFPFFSHWYCILSNNRVSVGGETAKKAHADFHISNRVQCQSKGRHPNPLLLLKRGCLGFREKDSMLPHNGTVCARIARGTTQRRTQSAHG